ncbi:Ser/Thr protein kinase RdoA (MazF antagonist) [Paenibacillus taihuensis]|uniref:Ser/Thr protein kinase RdoA (MazF antagonist) n=1 Tax=Paenibacillus taihuensis TaxID=1156355 RepID=A0A3D9RZI9_9BACL|nr:phosphotransferase [Paenibacillus taihuensis]REE85352.1 Ser/Thr protein kinase RdoA (MazF antagonist) [Paenibacillus taihuensis]
MMLLVNMWLGTVDDTPAGQLVLNWEHEANSLKFWRASSNFVYRFEADGGKPFWLRFVHEADNSIANIHAELHYIIYLIERGYAAAPPVPSLNGRLIETIETEQGRYYGVVFEQAEGNRVQADRMTEDQLQRWGQSLAQLHLHAADYEVSADLTARRSWEDTLRFISEVLERHPNEDAAIAACRRVEQWLRSLPNGAEHAGIIHYDFQLDNVFDRAQAEADAASTRASFGAPFSVIDFDDAMYHWYTMDIAAALADLDDLEEAQAASARALFLQGYASIRSLNDHHIDELHHQLPLFRRFSRLYSYARLLRCIEGLELDGAPEWLIGLHRKVLTWCGGMREEFS